MNNLGIEIYCDCAALPQMRIMADNPLISGFTTNPTIMRRAGVTDYLGFAREALVIAGERPISFEVFSDDFAEMYRQAMVLAALGPNVYVKIPVTDTRGNTTDTLIGRLSEQLVKVNVTAVMDEDQFHDAASNLAITTPSIISIFCGRIYDAGQNPFDVFDSAPHIGRDNLKILWASARQVYDVILANAWGADIITLTPELIQKIDGLGRDLRDVSLATVEQFYQDAKASGFTI